MLFYFSYICIENYNSSFMKFTRFPIFVFALLLANHSFSQQWTELINDPNSNFFEVQKSFNKYWEGKDMTTLKGWKQYKRWEYFMESRVDNSGHIPFQGEIWKVANHNSAFKKNNKGQINATWKFMGPSDIPTSSGGAGRINCIEFHPGDQNIIFAGAPAGGLWKSTNGGQTWSTNTDNLAVIGVSDILIDPVNPLIMYMATGDGDGGDTYSIGVLKSTNGGNSWDTTGLNWPVTSTRKIFKLLMDTSNTCVIYAATNVGIYKTSNSGNSWSLIRSGNFMDMEFKPYNPQVIYAATASSIVRTLDGGQTFATLAFPGSSTSRLALGVTPADSAYLYILAGKSSDQGFNGLYRSKYSGDSITLQSNSPNLLGWNANGGDIGGQAWFDLAIAVSPTNKDLIYTGGVNIWKSTNGGVNWELNAHWTGSGGAQYVHADIHALEYNNDNPPKLYAGCDGGIFVTSDHGNIWTDISKGLEIAQIYRLGASATNPNLILSGWQDNGTNLFSGSSNWKRVIGGDGMECAIDPLNPLNIYGELYYGRLKRSTNGGLTWFDIYKSITETGGWVTPFTLDPNDPNTIYLGYKNVWKSTDRGDNWTKISSIVGGANLVSLAVAPSNSDYIYATTTSGVYRTVNGGLSWTNVSVGVGAGSISYLAIHHDNPLKIYCTKSGYIAGSKVIYSQNGGDSWINISGNLPNIPANCIVFDKNSPEGIYVGTDVGVYYKDTTMSSWVPFISGMPNVVVNELEIYYPTKKIRAATYGRGLWESDLYSSLALSLTKKNQLDAKPSIYPNPANSSLNIDFANIVEDIYITIQNTIGEVVMKNKYYGIKTLSIDLNSYSSGLYLITVISGNISYTSKFIKSEN